ncbi:MAG: GNAT family N-acetyltransferase [Gammaproteobacteria bacterium]
MMSTRMPPLETSRLIIRPFSMDEIQRVHQILDIDLAGADMGNEKPASLPQRAEWLRWTILSYEQLVFLYQPPYGDRAIVLKSTGHLIGACGFVPSFGPFGQLTASVPPQNEAEPFFNNPEFGLFYTVAPAHQRQGYAAEAARAMVDYAFQHLGLQRIVATTTYGNAASIGVMRSIGMRIERNRYPDPPWFQVVGLLDNPSAGRRRAAFER